jgi:hypothetical protein
MSDNVGSMLELLQNQKSQLQSMASSMALVEARPLGNSLSKIFKEQASQTSPVSCSKENIVCAVRRSAEQDSEGSHGSKDRTLHSRADIRQALPIPKGQPESHQGRGHKETVPHGLASAMPALLILGTQNAIKSVPAGCCKKKVTQAKESSGDSREGTRPSRYARATSTENSNCPPYRPASPPEPCASGEHASHVIKGASSQSQAVPVKFQAADIVPWIKKPSCSSLSASVKKSQQQPFTKYVANIIPQANMKHIKSSAYDTMARDLSINRASKITAIDESAVIRDEGSHVLSVGILSPSPCKEAQFRGGHGSTTPGTNEGVSLFEQLLIPSENAKCKKRKTSAPALTEAASTKNSIEDEDIARCIAMKLQRHRAKRKRLGNLKSRCSVVSRGSIKSVD